MSSSMLPRSSVSVRAACSCARRPAPFASFKHQLQGSWTSSAFLPTCPALNARPVSSFSRRVPLRIQNVRVNNVEIPNNKRIEISLQYIYGIGPTSARKILSDAAIENKRTYELSEEEMTKIREEVGKYQTEADLRRAIAQNIKRLKDIGSYRGRRHIMGLPVRGQRTKTNARTRKGKPKTVAGKKKATR